MTIRPFLLALVLLALVLPPAASANVRLISVSSPVKAGSNAQVSVTAYMRVNCFIKVHYGSRPPISAAGLTARGTVFGVAQWRWKMPASATHGRWTIDVSCGRAGALRTYFLVR